MEINSKNLEQTSKIVSHSISAILCLFLILLSGKIIDDLGTTAGKPDMEDYKNKSLMFDLDGKTGGLNSELEQLNIKSGALEKTIETARENYRNEKQSFDNWVETRKTLGSPDKDKEVIERAKKLDEYNKIEQEWRNELNIVKAEFAEKERQLQEVRNLVFKENDEAQTRYSAELKRYELKVFLIRLLFVAPNLALGIFFFIRYRRHKFWPLFFGFTLFSLYAFFFGLVPYLPSYGGYVRYAVGIILSVGLGYYAIKSIRQFIESKQAELQISIQERAKNVQSEVAEKALENHFCPSCGKDFIVKKWEFPINNETDLYKLVTDFCRHCGLELFKKCGSCGHKNFAHLPYCSSCGTKTITVK